MADSHERKPESPEDSSTSSERRGPLGAMAVERLPDSSERKQWADRYEKDADITVDMIPSVILDEWLYAKIAEIDAKHGPEHEKWASWFAEDYTHHVTEIPTEIWNNRWLRNEIYAAVAAEDPDSHNSEHEKWVTWYENDKDHRASEIPLDILANRWVQKKIDEIWLARIKGTAVIDEATFFIPGQEDQDREDSFERSFLNADIDKFLKGEVIKFIQPILRLRTGEYTDTLSLEWFKQGKYDESGRYVLRSLISDLTKLGSKGEKRNAVYFAKNLLNEVGLNAYPGADLSTIAADAQMMILSDKSAEFYASGQDKPMGYLGRGNIREGYSAKYADQTSDEVKDMLFGVPPEREKTGEFAFDRKSIGEPHINKETGKTEFPNYVERYQELNNNGKTRIDAMVEFTSTLIADKALPVVQGFDGKDQWLLADSFHLYALLEKPDGTYDIPAMKMLRLKGVSDETPEEARRTGKKAIEELREHAHRLLNEFNSSISYALKEDLKNAIAEFVGNDVLPPNQQVLDEDRYVRTTKEDRKAAREARERDEAAKKAASAAAPTTP